MSRSQRGRLIVLALPFLGRPTSRPYLSTVARSAPRLATSRLTHLAHVQHGQRVCVLAPQRPQLAGRSAVERECRPTQERVGAVTAARQWTGSLRLRADLTILAKLARTRARARAVPFAA